MKNNNKMINWDNGFLIVQSFSLGLRFEILVTINQVAVSGGFRSVCFGIMHGSQTGLGRGLDKELRISKGSGLGLGSDMG